MHTVNYEFLMKLGNQPNVTRPSPPWWVWDWVPYLQDVCLSSLTLLHPSPSWWKSLTKIETTS